MTIDEAVKWLQEAEKWLQDELPLAEEKGELRLCAALRLGVEALKYIQRARQHDLYVKPERLPGETK